MNRTSWAEQSLERVWPKPAQFHGYKRENYVSRIPLLARNIRFASTFLEPQIPLLKSYGHKAFNHLTHNFFSTPFKISIASLSLSTHDTLLETLDLYKGTNGEALQDAGFQRHNLR